MSNLLYPKGKQALLEGGIAWLTNTIKAVAVDVDSYVFTTAHANLSDIPSGARISTSTALGTKTSTDGAADADDVVFTAVTGPTVEAVVLYKDSGNVNTSTLIAYIDTANGLPFTPNGGDLNVVWDNGANKIFKL